MSLQEMSVSVFEENERNVEKIKYICLVLIHLFNFLFNFHCPSHEFKYYI